MIDPDKLEVKERNYSTWSEKKLKNRLIELEKKIEEKDAQIRATSIFDPDIEGLQYQLGELLDEKEEIENQIY